MSLRNFATVLVRFYGVLLLFYCLQTSQQAYVYKTISAPSEPILRINFISSVATGIQYAVVGVCLLVFAKTIAGWVAPKTSDRINIIVSTSDLALVSFSLVGIYFFVDGISWLVHDGVAWYLTPKSFFDPTVLLEAKMTASLAMSAIKVAGGLFLLFGSRGVLRAIRWAQGEGGYEWKRESEEARQPTIELPKIPKCPSCGAEYNPGDYRQDVLEWLCSRCGTALPKD
jgi:hypothetical protein